MISELSMDAPMTRREFSTLYDILCRKSDELWLKADVYRRKIGMGKTQFYHLKKMGRFDKGTHPATLGCKHRLIHEHFNMHSQRIENPGKDYSEPITPKRRGKYGKKDKEGTTSGTGGRVRKEQHASHSQGRTGNEAGQYMPGSEERPQA
jgi:hypothetical protein